VAEGRIGFQEAIKEWNPVVYRDRIWNCFAARVVLWAQV
jgi:hypothetical protein